ncbi:hypothetical protein HanRHA438_Chr12g0544101 [Helianthus annuus]|nr:hypothetical protein HanRHA438_Chr12g0544101 [Helianthus annuus]
MLSSSALLFCPFRVVVVFAFPKKSSSSSSSSNLFPFLESAMGGGSEEVLRAGASFFSVSPSVGGAGVAALLNKGISFTS